MILVLIIILQLPAAALAGSSTRFSLCLPAWYEDYMQKLIWLEIIKGYPDGTFGPTKGYQGEFLKMITIAAELYTTTKP